MRFAVLGSGSRGNATVICNGQTRLLVDCGFSRRETETRLQRHALSPEAIDAILVTHEHSDHVSGVARLSRKYKIPVYATHGTARAADLCDLEGLVEISAQQQFGVGTLQVQSFPVPHDAREPVQFVVSQNDQRIGILSDAGMVTAHMREVLSGCDALLLECNHCPQMLAAGPYPPALKRRVASRLGHLSNQQSAELLGGLDTSRLQHLAITHVSEKNNCPELARSLLANVLGEQPDWLVVADQDQGLPWRQLEAR